MHTAHARTHAHQMGFKIKGLVSKHQARLVIGNHKEEFRFRITGLLEVERKFSSLPGFMDGTISSALHIPSFQGNVVVKHEHIP